MVVIRLPPALRRVGGLRPPGQPLRRGFGWVATQPLAIGHALAGKAQNETPMTDDKGVCPVMPVGEIGAETGRSIDDGMLWFFLRWPPDFLHPGEIVVGPVAFQCGARGADVTGEGEALTHN